MPACRDAPALNVEIEGCGHRPCRRLNWHKNRIQNLLLLPFAASSLCNIRHTSQIWRKRVGVEPTIRPAKDRITGFEGRESHRTLFASENSIVERFADAQGNVRSHATPEPRPPPSHFKPHHERTPP